MFEGLTCVYRSNVDLFFYVVGSSQENEVSKKQNIRGSKLCRSEVHDHSGIIQWVLADRPPRLKCHYLLICLLKLLNI